MSLAWGQSPLWAHRLPPEELEIMIGLEMAEQEEHKRKKLAERFREIERMGGTVTRGDAV